MNLSFDLSQLAPLASAVESAGAPILGAALRAGSTVATAAPFPLNLVLPVVLNSIAGAVDAPANDPAAIASKIANDPTAAAKIQAVEALHRDNLQNALEMAKLQTDQNTGFNAAAPVWLNFVMAGWRPAFAWGVVIWANILLVRSFLGYATAEGFLAFWNPVWMAFGGMLALRTVEKWAGVASPLTSVPAAVRRIVARRG